MCVYTNKHKYICTLYIFNLYLNKYIAVHSPSIHVILHCSGKRSELSFIISIFQMILVPRVYSHRWTHIHSKTSCMNPLIEKLKKKKDKDERSSNL
jgi:hypothetical protein